MAFWSVRPATTMRSPGLVATLMLMFLFTDIEGPAAMVQRPGGAQTGALAGQNRLIRPGLLTALRCGRWATRRC